MYCGRRGIRVGSSLFETSFIMAVSSSLLCVLSSLVLLASAEVGGGGGGDREAGVRAQRGTLFSQAQCASPSFQLMSGITGHRQRKLGPGGFVGCIGRYCMRAWEAGPVLVRCGRVGRAL